jgi:hypothetical protein
MSELAELLSNFVDCTLAATKLPAVLVATPVPIPKTPAERREMPVSKGELKVGPFAQAITLVYDTPKSTRVELRWDIPGLLKPTAKHPMTAVSPEGTADI